MPAKDIYHDIVKRALIKDGWTITHDPLRLQWGPKDMYVDLGAERLVAAEKAGRKIAVKVKSFIGPSEIEDLRCVGTICLVSRRNDQDGTQPRFVYRGARRDLCRTIRGTYWQSFDGDGTHWASSF